MNRYGELAQRHWQTFLPRRYSQIEDPQAFFTTLGAEVEQEIDQMTEDLLAHQDPSPERDYLAEIGRRNAARSQAREKVLAERVLLPAEPGSPQDEEPPEEPSAGGTRSTPWIPVAEDPADPWWQEQDQTNP
ncbi:hypothetical protein DI005_20100 [Prauserella sp. PE36]|uniref:hypothetical protein n=1 Tax=Prauserella sp. PE36 TaxID=1504709 RepID=UPI000DE444EB|nr:hypothetical protein [Prauserella sp. PE36]RBM18098.1 hypothetical protein DI005_20100 [Prauserella sp. PE36]